MSLPSINTPLRIYIFTGFSEKTSLGWFISHWVFLLSCKRKGVVGLTSLPAWQLWTPFKDSLHIVVARRIKWFTIFFNARLIRPVPSVFCFCHSMVIVFYIFASFKQIWTTKCTGINCRSYDRKWLGKPKISRVEKKRFAGYREAELNQWVGFQWVCYRGCRLALLQSGPVDRAYEISILDFDVSRVCWPSERKKMDEVKTCKSLTQLQCRNNWRSVAWQILKTTKFATWGHSSDI